MLGIFRQPINTVFVCLLKFGSGAISFYAAAHGVFAGQYLYSNNVFRKEKFRLIPGCKVAIKILTTKHIFCQIAPRTSFIQYVRAAGTYTFTYQRYEDACLITCTLSTGLKKILSFDDIVTLGRNSNIYYRHFFLAKCGNNKKIGFKSKVRGVAMNPVDHPHGGRTKTSSPELSP